MYLHTGHADVVAGVLQLCVYVYVCVYVRVLCVCVCECVPFLVFGVGQLFVQLYVFVDYSRENDEVENVD